MRPGTVIAGKYTMTKLINLDGPNQTWMAKTSLKQTRALKFSEMYPRTSAQIEQEKELYQKIKHQKLVSLYQIFEQAVEGRNYRVIVTDFFQDGDFTKVITLDSKSDKHKLKLLLDIAEGLDYLHSNNILHRNIKPENMFRKGDVGKLGDFGLAKLVKISYARKTTAAGPPIYKSYETYYREEYDASADVWSFGLVILETALRKSLYEFSQWQRPPCQDFQEVEKLLKTARMDYPQLCNLISRMLLKDPKKRLKMSEVKQELRKLYECKISSVVELVAIRIQLTLSSEVPFPILSKIKKEHYEKARNELKGTKQFMFSQATFAKGAANLKIKWEPQTDNLIFSGLNSKHTRFSYEQLHPDYRRHFPTNYHILREITAKDENGKQKQVQIKGKSINFKAIINNNNIFQQDYQPIAQEVQNSPRKDNPSVPQPSQTIAQQAINLVRPEFSEPRYEGITPSSNSPNYLQNFPIPGDASETIDGLSDLIDKLWDQQPYDFYRIAQTLLKKAKLLSDTHMYNRAVSMCEEAINTLELGNIQNQINGLAWQAMGIYYSYSKKYDMALKCLEKSGEIFQRLMPNTIQDVNNICVIGGVFFAKGDLEMAEYFSANVMERLSHMLGYYSPSTVFMMIAAGKLRANVLAGRGKLNEAVIEYSKVMELMQHSNTDIATVLSVRMNIISCLNNLGQTQKALIEMATGFDTIKHYGGISNPAYYMLFELAIDTISKRISGYGTSKELLTKISNFAARYLPQQEGLVQQIAMKMSQFS